MLLKSHQPARGKATLHFLENSDCFPQRKDWSWVFRGRSPRRRGLNSSPCTCGSRCADLFCHRCFSKMAEISSHYGWVIQQICKSNSTWQAYSTTLSDWMSLIPQWQDPYYSCRNFTSSKNISKMPLATLPKRDWKFSQNYTNLI